MISLNVRIFHCWTKAFYTAFSSSLEQLPDHCVHFDLVRAEFSDSFAQFLCGHLVFIHHPPEKQQHNLKILFAVKLQKMTSYYHKTMGNSC